jgi:hypothetical protein
MKKEMTLALAASILTLTVSAFPQHKAVDTTKVTGKLIQPLPLSQKGFWATAVLMFFDLYRLRKRDSSWAELAMSVPRGLMADLYLVAFTARLRTCPFKI